MDKKKELELQEIKEIELNIMDYIHEICIKNNFNYFLSYGSLLGAIRHGGFIPWDDDIDIVMPRPDYNRFVEFVKKHNTPQYDLRTPSDEDYCYEFSKVVDSSTYVIEDNCEGTQIGVWVDIFPLDGLKKSDTIQNQLLYILQRCRVASIYKTAPKTRVYLTPIMYLFWKICKAIGPKTILKKVVSLSQKYSYEDSDYVGFAPSIHSLNKFMPKDWFRKQVDIVFEDRTYKAPIGYNEYLKSLYGDYMQLPPEDKRIPHKVKAYYK